MKRWLAAAGAGSILLLVLSACSVGPLIDHLEETDANADSSPEPTPPPRTTPPPARIMPPPGYFMSQDDYKLAWQWVEGDLDCGPNGATKNCWQIRVFAREDCPGTIYARLNIENEGGDVINAVESTMTALREDQTGLVTFLSDFGGFGSVEALECR